MPMVLLFIVFIIVLLPKYFRFRNSDYQFKSGNSFFKTIFDKGSYGEFLTFSYLEELKIFKKLLVNIYVPKEDGLTTEIDLIMLSPTGIYVFESKNYSGWIFGNEKSRYWTQTLESKQKNKFYNPIWQNKGHITALKKLLELQYDDIFKSYIIFSERCTLKKLEYDSSKTKLIKRDDLISTLNEDIANSPNILKVDEILNTYTKLKEYSNVDDIIKKKHIENIS